MCAKHAEQVCIVLMVSACVHPLGVKQPGALQDYATSAAAASDNTKSLRRCSSHPLCAWMGN